MDGLFNMVVLYVRYYPHISGVLAERVTRILSRFGTLVVLLSRVLGRNSNRVKVENVVVTLGEPQDGFVPPREPSATVKSMLEVPDNAVPQPQAEIDEDRVEESVKRLDLASLNVVAHLPADASALVEDSHGTGDSLPLGIQIRP
jgi:hypothetical protein